MFYVHVSTNKPAFVFNFILLLDIPLVLIFISNELVVNLSLSYVPVSEPNDRAFPRSYLFSIYSKITLGVNIALLLK